MSVQKSDGSFVHHPCRALAWDAKRCYAMPCHAMSCPAMPWVHTKICAEGAYNCLHRRGHTIAVQEGDEYSLCPPCYGDPEKAGVV